MVIKTIFLGTQHPHMFHRFDSILNGDLGAVEIVGFFDDEVETAQKVAQKYPSVKRYLDAETLLNQPFDVCFIHALDHDVPRLAISTIPYKPKALFLEKPGAAVPEDLFQLKAELDKHSPQTIVEFGWEMHYSDVMDFARHVVRSDCLGDITGAHFHGGTPSGGGAEKWQSLDTTLGGFMYTDASHTLEQVIDLFGLPNRVVSSVRKLPLSEHEFECVGVLLDLFDTEISKVAMKVGSLRHEDIGSAIFEYNDKNIAVDFTAWEAKPWCADWSIDIYGTNGIFHAFLSPAVATLFLRESRQGFKKGETTVEQYNKPKNKDYEDYFSRQMKTFLGRVESGNDDMEKCDIVSQEKLMKLLSAIFRSAKENQFVST